jgi:hypothetical protein
MLKLKNLLDALEAICVTSPDFVKVKLNVQDELYIQYAAETDPSVRHFLLQTHTTWRKLGRYGTLKAFSDAIYDLRSTLRVIELMEANR